MNTGSIIKKENKEYPELLRQIRDAPKKLYYKGTWNPELFEHCLAVVGTRRMTHYGKRVTHQIAGEIAARGITIVSGFMYGIDAESHKAALMAGGKTIAVMPCGIDLVRPADQADLYEEILATGGLVVSEYEGIHPATKWTFPRRNRIVAGLSKATLVVEAGEHSGALITANLAKRYGRKVFAIPNPLTSAVSQGVTRLLQEGAGLVGSAQDILYYYYGVRPKPGLGKPKPGLGEIEGELERRVFQQLAKEPMEVDMLSRKLSLPPSQLGAILSLLQLEGYISADQGRYYAT